MSADLQDRPAPEPGSPAAFLQRLLADAFAQKKRAAAATFLDWSGLDRACSFAVGADVKVAVIVRRGATGVEEHDVVRLDRVWTLVDSGATLLHMGCPDKPPPVRFMAAAMVWDAQGVRHDLVVVDDTGGVGALAETAVVDGKQVGKTLRTQVLRFGQEEEKARAKKASAKLNQQESGMSPVRAGHAIFASGVARHIMEDPTRRGIDPDRPLLRWSYKTVDPEGNERIVAVSDPTFAADPLSRAATAGVSALGVDEWKRTKPSELGANVWERDIGTVDASPSPTYENVHRAPEDHEMKPRADDRRKWQDGTGELGTRWADNRLELNRLLGEEWSAELASHLEDLEIDPTWDDAGVNDDEKRVLLLILAGFKQREIAGVIGRDQSAVSRIAARARKKIQKS
jgi:hypothetical protein